MKTEEETIKGRLVAFDNPWIIAGLWICSNILAVLIFDAIGLTLSNIVWMFIVFMRRR